jgi:catechol 2,3-dioxygenase-like lactoylglutathione lyase family enzyme
VVPVIAPISAHATIAVSNFERAKAFYGGRLGLVLVQEQSEGAWYQAGESQIYVYPSQFAGTAQSTSAALYVEDLEVAIKELNDAGVSMEEYDLPGVKTVNGIIEMDGQRAAWFKDPDGNIIAIEQRV